MYVSSKGLAGRRRGMGATSVVTGPDGQPRVVMTDPITTDTVLPSGENVFQGSGGEVLFVSDHSLIPGIPNYVLGIAGGVFGLVLLSKVMR